MPVITNIADLQKLARRRVPRMFYQYADSGSWTEQTYRANEQDVARIGLNQKVAVNLETRSLASTMLGAPVSMPLAFSPVGMCGMQCADGEIKAARAANAFGVPFSLSTMSICSIEDLATETGKPFWFQLYVMRDQEFSDRLIERARAAKCSALIVTLDLQLLAQRHNDLKNDLTAPPRLTVKNLINLSTKWRWGMGMLGTRRHTFGNIVGHAKGVTNMNSLMEWTSDQFDLALDWEKVKAIKKKWGGKMILKGILNVDDARKAVETGADAIIVSNHGGRQLDGAVSSIEMLPQIVDAVGDKIEVLFDGGIRSGQSVLKAVALGAKGAFIGRPYLYALGAEGQRGVEKMLAFMHKEMDVTMALMGHNDIQNVGRDDLIDPAKVLNPWMGPAA